MGKFLIIISIATVWGVLTVTAADDLEGGAQPIVIGKDGLPVNKVDARETVEKQPEFVAPKSIEEIAGTGTNFEAVAPAPAPAAVDWEPIVQAMQLMIDQQKLALQSMEQARADTIQTSKENTEAMGEKMTKLEDSLSAQRTHEAESINRMNRLVVGVAAGFAGTGFVVMVLTAWFFMRTMNRVAEINANIQSQLLALPNSQPQLVGDGPSGQAGNRRLLGALEQLEKRIRDLEHTSGGADGAHETSTASSPTSLHDEPSLGVEAEFVGVDQDEESPSINALMAKGQTLLNLDDAEQALVCFDAVLKRDPRNADAFLKKGTALERLRRMQEALDAYDAALEEDDSLTMAYLAKGGICNRLERYAEALECYERALHVQQQGAV